MRVTGKLGYIGLVLVMFVPALTTTAAHAQTVTAPVIEYTVKFMCGLNPTTGTSTMATPGSYKTSVNIHNPALPAATATPLTFFKKAVLATPEPPVGQPIPPSALRTDTLAPDFAEEVDCPIIRSMLGAVAAGGVFIEGWVVIYVPQPVGAVTKLELDVEAVTTNFLGGLVIKKANEHDF